MELVPYQFVRPPSEYQGHFRESDVLARMAKEYGFSNVAIEDFPTGQTWQPVVGELWITAPDTLKLYDIHDIPESLASLECNRRHHRRSDRRRPGDGAGFRGQGRQREVRPLAGAQRSWLASMLGRWRRGAIGVLGISAIGAGDRAVDYPDGGRVDYRVGAARHGGLGALAAEPRARSRPCSIAGQTVTIRSLDPERAGPQQAGNRPCRDPRRRQHDRRRLPSAGISSRATSSREPTTTTRAAP